VLRTIVEGEPGIFPDPVARVMRTIGGWFGRRRPAEPAADTPPSAGDGDPRPGGDPPSAGDGDRHSGEST
jgi:hypothetical protein